VAAPPSVWPCPGYFRRPSRWPCHQARRAFSALRPRPAAPVDDRADSATVRLSAVPISLSSSSGSKIAAIRVTFAADIAFSSACGQPGSSPRGHSIEGLSDGAPPHLLPAPRPRSGTGAILTKQRMGAFLLHQGGSMRAIFFVGLIRQRHRRPLDLGSRSSLDCL